MQWCVEIKCGQYISFEQGTPKACSPSPWMVAIYIASLYKHLKDKRYINDCMVLLKTRSQLRKVIKITHQVLKSLKLCIHPKKNLYRINTKRR